MWVPYQPKTLFIEPFLGDGYRPGGLVVSYNENLPPVFGRVVATKPDVHSVLPDTVVIYRAHTFDEVVDSYGTKFCVITERALHGILEGYDDEKAKLEKYAA